MSTKDDLTNNKKKKKVNYMSIMMFIVIIMGLFVGAGSFGLSYRYMMDSSEGENEEERFSANDVLEQAQANLIGSEIDAVVRSKDVTKGNINLLNLKNETSTTVVVTDASVFPKNTTIDTIQVGDIVTYVFDKDRNLTELKNCKDEWSISDSGVALNTAAKLVKFTSDSKTSSDKSFKYVDGITTVRYKGQLLKLENLSPLDYVTLHGYDDGRINKVYNIEIEKSHGELQIQNMNSIKDAKVFINDKEYDLSKEPRVVLTEGSYNLKITSDNADDITRQINITPNEPCVVDLSKVMVKTGVLQLSSNVSDYKLVINGKQYDANQSIILEYGTYTLQATKEGYKSVNATISINADINPVSIQMQKSQQAGTVNITATPANAQIMIDGKAVGTGAVTLNLSVGSYIASCSAEGYNTDKKQINVSADKQVINVAFDLTLTQ